MKVLQTKAAYVGAPLLTSGRKSTMGKSEISQVTMMLKVKDMDSNNDYIGMQRLT
jgi:hypothetical protein